MRVLFAGKTKTRVVALYPIERERDGFTLPAARLVVEPRVRHSGGEQEMIEVTVMAVGSRFPKTAPQECRIAHRRRRGRPVSSCTSRSTAAPGVSSISTVPAGTCTPASRMSRCVKTKSSSPRVMYASALLIVILSSPSCLECGIVETAAFATSLAVLPGACAGRVPASARGRRVRRAAPGPRRQTPLPARGQAHSALSPPGPRSQSPGQ